MGSGEWGVGSGEWGVGSGGWGVGSGEWGVGSPLWLPAPDSPMTSPLGGLTLLGTVTQPQSIASQPQRTVLMPEYKDCPFCAEQILAVAMKCKHCGEYLDDDFEEERRPQKSADTLTRLIAPVEISVMSLIAGYMGLFALFPLVGIVPAIIGILLGWGGLKEIERKPNLSGAGRSWFAIISGVICLIAWSILGVVLAFSGMPGRR